MRRCGEGFGAGLCSRGPDFPFGVQASHGIFPERSGGVFVALDMYDAVVEL